MDNPVFAVVVSRNDIPKPVEELSTYPHRPWITHTFAAIVGMARRVLRRPSTAGRAILISPTRCPRIIHNVSDLSTENGRLSPASVESPVLRFPHTLVE